MQIGATLFMFGSIDSAFSPLFGIQLAAFLMTLVRKSIISCTMWHICYALSLWINIGLYYTLPLNYILIHCIAYNTYTIVFFQLKTNKYINWAGIFTLMGLYNVMGTSYDMGYLDALIRHTSVGVFLLFQLYSSRGLWLPSIKV